MMVILCHFFNWPDITVSPILADAQDGENVRAVKHINAVGINLGRVLCFAFMVLFEVSGIIYLDAFERQPFCIIYFERHLIVNRKRYDLLYSTGVYVHRMAVLVKNCKIYFSAKIIPPARDWGLNIFIAYSVEGIDSSLRSE